MGKSRGKGSGLSPEMIAMVSNLNHKQCNELKKILRINVWYSQWKRFDKETKQYHIRRSVTNTFASQSERLKKYLLEIKLKQEEII